MFVVIDSDTADGDGELVLAVGVKKSTSAPALTGSFESNQIGENASGVYTSRVAITSNGDGTGTWAVVSHSQSGPGSGSFTYTVSTDGTFIANNGIADDHGIVSPDGRMLAVTDTSTTDGDDEIIFAVGIKK